MTMTESQIALIKEIAAEENFGTTLSYDGYLSNHGKEWFCTRLAENALKPPNDSMDLNQLEQSIRQGIDRATALIQRWSPLEDILEVAETHPSVTRLARRLLRQRALYHIIPAALVIQPELSLPTNESVFKQVIAQRLRIVERMDLDVNASGLVAAFRYPDSDEEHQLNNSVRPFWDSHPSARWTLSDMGKSDSESAISLLFVAASEANRNRVYCQHAATAVLLDGLLPIDGLDGFQLNSVAQTPGYLFLDTPYAEATTVHFLNDPNGRYEQVEVDLDNVQVGDHVYAENLDIYNLVKPEGLWAGEHAIVISRFSDDLEFNFGMREDIAGKSTKLEGLGMPDLTVHNMRDKLLYHANSVLHAARVRVLDHISAHGNTNGPDTIDFIKLNDPGYPSASVLTIYRDKSRESGLSPEFLPTVWYVEPNPLSQVHHYVWEEDPTPPEFDFWNETVTEPPPIKPKYMTVAQIWGQRHPLLGSNNQVRVIRPKIGR